MEEQKSALGNFVISYTERTGSTALIDTLKMIGVKIPVFEELDFYWQEAHGGPAALTQDNIHARIDMMYQNHGGPGVSVGFKWRVWGEASKIASVFKKHDCIIFNLTRCEPFEYISSLYLSHVSNKDLNSAQFQFVEAETAEAKKAITDRYRTATYRVCPDLFFGLFEQKIADERVRLGLLKNLEDQGLKVISIFYEDFAYKRYVFLASLVARLSGTPLESLPLPTLEKITTPFPSSLFENRDDLLRSSRLIEYIRRWNGEVTECGFEKLSLTV